MADSKKGTFDLKSVIIILALTFLVSFTKPQKIKKRINEYLADPRPDQTKLRFVLESGGMNGHFKSKELYDILSYLQETYPQYITSKQPGKTVQGNPILAYTLHKPQEQRIKKS